MKITRLLLKNIRCFDTLELKFDGASALILGDNGDGKSTVLRSLAMGVCDQSSAAALFRELPGEFVREGTKGDAYIQVDLAANGGWRYRIRTTFIALEAFERIEQTHFRAKGSGSFRPVQQDDFPWSAIFASGYGPGIRTYGNADYSYYLPVDAVYSLFRYDAALQSPELVIRRLVDDAGTRNIRHRRRTLLTLQRALRDILNLEYARDVELTRRGIFITGPWGRRELATLGDGYRATTTWTLDLISWWLLYDDEPAHEFSASDLVGTVIIDELEQHLHPRWQRMILTQLRTLFPNIQFIVATHSPLLASSCPDVIVYRLENGQVVVARDVELTRRGIFITGPWGRRELATLGDGYRATTTWTLDLISWWLLYDDEPAHEFSASDLVGTVIIDELEQHLHPRWQRMILTQLRTLFPNIQFIVATHSPLLASSCPDVIVYRLENGQVTDCVPYGWRAEDVYQMMGISTSRAPGFQADVVAMFTRLDETRLQRDLSPAEAARLRKLRAKLNRLPPNDPARVAIELHNMVKSLKRGT